MTDSMVMQRFIKERPLCVMARCVMGHVMTAELDQVFDDCRQRQYENELKFSALAASVADVALGFCENFNQSYKQNKEELRVTVEAYYGKINRVETSTSEGVVEFGGRKAGELLHEIGAGEWEVLRGYKCSVLDGNHLQKSEKRLAPLRGLCAAALPGTVVAKYDLQCELFERAYLLEDAHAQESTVLDRVIADLKTKELLIADRHFCIVKFMLDVAAAECCFVIRQHGRLKGELQGKRHKIGRCETGIVHQQKLRISDGDRVLTVRRITVELDTPTRDGDREIHILSNLPRADATSVQVATLYHQRWEIENAFHILTMTLTCEVKSIGHPSAALFLFAMAMLAYNCRQVLYAALWTTHDQADVAALSQHAVALEIVRPMDGLLIAIPASQWASAAPTTARGCAAFLCRVSQYVDVRKHRKTTRGPKKPKQPRAPCKAGTHVSTHRLLEA